MHLKNDNLAKDVDLEAVAEECRGMNGRDIREVWNSCIDEQMSVVDLGLPHCCDASHGRAYRR